MNSNGSFQQMLYAEHDMDLASSPTLPTINPHVNVQAPPQEFHVYNVQDYLTSAYPQQVQVPPIFLFNAIPALHFQDPLNFQLLNLPALNLNDSQPPIPLSPSPRQYPTSPRLSPRQGSAPTTPRTSPRKTDHTNDFGRKFQSFIHNNQKASSQWRKFRNENKGHCSIKRCIRLRLAFCEKYGHEFSSLATSKCFRGLGTRSNCKCTISSSQPSESPCSPMPLSPPTPCVGSPMQASPPAPTMLLPAWPVDHQAKVISYLEQLARSEERASRRNMAIPLDGRFCTDYADV